MIHLTDQMPIRTAAMSTLPWTAELEARYKFQSNFGEDVNMSVKVGNMLMVPRQTCPISVTDDHRVSFEPHAINCNFIPRTEEQEDLIAKSVALLKSGQDHIFDAPTGWGKTIAGSVIACRLGQPTIIVVTKEDLMEQWYNSLVLVLGVPPELVGKVQQNTCEWQGKMFVIAMVHSLVIPDRYDPLMYKSFGFAIFDEVHLMAADTFVKACQILPAKYRLGFSATAIRKDGKTRLLFGHIGQVLIHGTIIPMAPKVIVRYTGWKIPVRRTVENGVWVEKPIPHSPGRMALVQREMGKSVARNKELVEFTLQAVQKERVVLMLSDLIEGHLHILFSALTAAGIPGNLIGYYVGGMKKHELEATKKAQIVLGTYAMCSTGTDVPRWDTLVMCTPRADVKQSIGRVMRMMKGKKTPIIFDPVDFNSIFNNYFKSRMKTYYSVGAEIVKF